MAITFPLSPPAALKVAKISITARTSIVKAQSPFTFQPQVQVNQGQAWMIEVSLPPLKRAEAEQVLAFLLAMNNGEGTFTLGHAAGATSRGTISGSPTCNGTQTARGTTLLLTGHSGSLALGDWIQISTNLYKVVQVNSGTSVEVFPALRSAYANGTAIVYTNAVGLWRLPKSETSWDIDNMRIYGIAFSAMEEVP